MVIIFACQNILIFLQDINWLRFTCFGFILQSLLFKSANLIFFGLYLNLRLLLPLLFLYFLLLDLLGGQFWIYFAPHHLNSFKYIYNLQQLSQKQIQLSGFCKIVRKIKQIQIRVMNRMQHECYQKYIIKKNKRSMDVESSVIVELDEIIDISSAQIVQVLSMTMSLTKKFCVVGTENGFCLVDNGRKSFKRFENNKNPFRKEDQTGVELGTALQERSEVAIIPSRTSKSYSRSVVYIFDYQLNTILYSNDFFLPIRQITLTDDTIIVSNNKRIIIYNYSNDLQQKTQEYYLKMYASQEPNNNIRYLEMDCEERLMNNSIKELDGDDQRPLKECMCGKYAISGVKPYKMVYVKVYSMNGIKMFQLSIYNSAYDKDYVFESFNYNEPFSFTISEDGNYVSHSQNSGRNIVVYKLGEKGVYCNLSVSSSIKECLSHGFFTYDDNVWYTVLRRGDKSTGHMHFFRIQKKKQDKQVMKSRYSRYFTLFQRTLMDYGVSDKLIGPDFYVVNGGVFSPSACGAVVQVIDFKISGNHMKKNSQNIVKWMQDLS